MDFSSSGDRVLPQQEAGDSVLGKIFTEAASGLDDLEKSVAAGLSKLRGYRLVPRPTLDELSKSVSDAIKKAQDSLADASTKHPDYLDNDPVLDRLLKLFEGRVGAPPSAEARVNLIEQGKRRHAEQIPPGYMDEDKEGERKYGDFLLWSEVLTFGKSVEGATILVTSERKEDWWERASGKTLGPRQELLEEFYTATEQPILIYQTENFLRLANEHAGTGINEEAVEEIRSLSARRAHSRSGNPPAVAVEQVATVAEFDENHGLLEVQLLREVHFMTGSGSFDPQLDGVPDLAATVISSPDGCPPLNLSARTGTTFDFNVHIRSGTPGVKLPVGSYQIEYSAVCPDEDNPIVDDRPDEG